MKEKKSNKRTWKLSKDDFEDSETTEKKCESQGGSSSRFQTSKEPSKDIKYRISKYIFCCLYCVENEVASKMKKMEMHANCWLLRCRKFYFAVLLQQFGLILVKAQIAQYKGPPSWAMNPLTIPKLLVRNIYHEDDYCVDQKFYGLKGKMPREPPTESHRICSAIYRSLLSVTNSRS